MGLLRRLFHRLRPRSGSETVVALPERTFKDSLPASTISNVEKLRNHRVNCSWPELYYDKIQNLIGIARPSSVVEIGVAYGYHAHDILDRNPTLSYVGIDPYRAGYDPDDLFDRDVCDLFGMEPQEAMDCLFDTVARDLVESHGNRARVVREASVEASAGFERDSLDFVFVDGDHRYEAVTADLAAWWPKVKLGGVMAGDDYAWSDVRQAVNDFFHGLPGCAVTVLMKPEGKHLSWFVVKPDGA